MWRQLVNLVKNERCVKFFQCSEFFALNMSTGFDKLSSVGGHNRQTMVQD